MPVRSLTSPVITWPDAGEVQAGLRRWAREAAECRPSVTRIGYLGSYARGDWGVGSDVGLLVIVTASAMPFVRRSRDFDSVHLAVPADVLVYTENEWACMKRCGRRIAGQTIIWVHGLAGYRNPCSALWTPLSGPRATSLRPAYDNEENRMDPRFLALLMSCCLLPPTCYHVNSSDYIRGGTYGPHADSTHGRAVPPDQVDR